MKQEYRINYGNGQVSQSVYSLREARVLYAQSIPDAYTRIEAYDGDDFWKRVKT